MIETSFLFMDVVDAKDRIERARGGFLPQLRDIRRVPARYHRMLPLPMIKSHQCVVLGATAHTLTIGVVERKDERWLIFLQALTGTTIFPVLVEPERMRLLIARVERYQRFRQRCSSSYYVLQLPCQVRQFLQLRESRGF